MTCLSFAILIVLVLVLSANCILNAQSPAGDRARAFVDAIIMRIRGTQSSEPEDKT